MKINGAPVEFKTIGRETRHDRMLSNLQRLWLVKLSSKHPDLDKVHAYVSSGIVIIKSINLAEYESGGEYSPLLPEHKYRPAINTTHGIIIKCIRFVDCSSKLYYFKGAATLLKSGRVFAPGPIEKNTIEALAKSQNILWIDAAREFHRRHSIESRYILTGVKYNAPYGGGTGRLLITDTGLDPFHCMFYPRVVNTGETVYLNGSSPNNLAEGMINIVATEYYPGKITQTNTYTDAHGSSTCGVAVGKPCGDNMGVAPNTSFVIFQDVSGPTSETLYIPMDFTSTFEMAYKYNITVHSASWGSNNQGEYDDLANQFDEAARNYNILHVISAGNSGPLGIIGSPATAKNALSVGATLSEASNFIHYSLSERTQHPEWFSYMSVAAFSSVGPLADGRRAPIVMAPGVSVEVAYALPGESSVHDDYIYEDGTSFSAPAVAGLALLLDEQGFNTAQSKMAFMIASARPTERIVQVDYNTITLLENAGLQYGVPVLTASTLLENTISNDVPRIAYSFSSEMNNLTIALAWLDVPAFPFATKTLINDLDLVVIINGSEYYPNDHLMNNERLVFTNNIIEGRIVVIASSMIMGGPQPFALSIIPPIIATINGTCLLTDRVACGGGFLLCDPATGLYTTCVYSTTPTPPLSTSCLLVGGQGFMEGSTCIAATCDPGYYILNSMCQCLPSRACDDGSVANCDANNLYGPCMELSVTQAPLGVIRTHDYMSPEPPISPLIVAWIAFGAIALFLMLLGCYLIIRTSELAKRSHKHD